MPADARDSAGRTRSRSGDAALVTVVPDGAGAPPPDPGADPQGFLVGGVGDVRLHFLDWGVPSADASGTGPDILLVPGLMAPAWTWAPVARRLAGRRRVVVADLRGHGLSDAPSSGYDLATLAADLVAVADGAGLDRVVLGGHGFGGCIAATAAAAMGERCAGLVLLDGGFERIETVTGLDADEFLRGLDEPPEVMRSMAAWLADRRAFGPPSWDADQERAARDAVVETAAGRVVRAVRPFVVEAVVRSMFGYDPAPTLAGVLAPVTALVALASGDPAPRLVELRRAAEARVAAGGEAVCVVGLDAAHNLPRYRPAEVGVALLAG